jgi:hypothetical protein
MHSDRDIDKLPPETHLLFSVPNDDWIDRYRASLPKDIDGGERMTIVQRIADVSERFSHAVMVGLCTLLLRGKDAFWGMVYASRGSRRVVPYKPEVPMPKLASTAGIPVQSRPGSVSHRRAS